MEKLIVKGTEETPHIIFDPENNKFEISGTSIPEDVEEFFKSSTNWIKDYVLNPLPSTTIEFKMEYFNTASSKLILEMLNLFSSILNSEKSLNVKWHYEEDDEDMLSAGQAYKKLSKVPIELVVSS